MSRDPEHAHLGIVLWSLRMEAPSSMSVPNLKQIALFVQKLLGGTKISQLYYVTQAMPIYIVLCSIRRRVCPPSLYQIRSGLLNSFKSY